MRKCQKLSKKWGGSQFMSSFKNVNTLIHLVLNYLMTKDTFICQQQFLKACPQFQG